MQHMEETSEERKQIWVSEQAHKSIKAYAALSDSSIIKFVDKLVDMWRQAEEIQILYEGEPPPMNE